MNPSISCIIAVAVMVSAATGVGAERQLEPPTRQAVGAAAGLHPLLFTKEYIESKNWLNKNAKISYIKSSDIKTKRGHALLIALYGVDKTQTATVVDTYIKYGENYVLIGHDIAALGVAEVRVEYEKDREFVSIVRNRVGGNITYAYCLTKSGELVRAVSTILAR